jgi:methyl coenzyme M reductase alpha subunit
MNQLSVVGTTNHVSHKQAITSYTGHLKFSKYFSLNFTENISSQLNYYGKNYYGKKLDSSYSFKKPKLQCIRCPAILRI